MLCFWFVFIRLVYPVWWTFSITLLDVDGAIAIVSTHHINSTWCIYKWPPSIPPDTTRNASHSNRTVFLTTFIVTFSIYNLPLKLQLLILNLLCINWQLLYCILINTGFSKWYVRIHGKYTLSPTFICKQRFGCHQPGQYVRARVPLYFKDQSVPII